MRIISFFTTFFTRFAELLTAVIAVIVMYAFNNYLQSQYDAGTLDMVVLIRPFFFIYELFIIHAGLWLLWKIVYPGMAKFLDVDFKKFILSDQYLSIWQKIIIVTVLWSAYLLFVGLLVVSGIMS